MWTRSSRDRPEMNRPVALSDHDGTDSLPVGSARRLPAGSRRRCSRPRRRRPRTTPRSGGQRDGPLSPPAPPHRPPGWRSGRAGPDRRRGTYAAAAKSDSLAPTVRCLVSVRIPYKSPVAVSVGSVRSLSVSLACFVRRHRCRVVLLEVLRNYRGRRAVVGSYVSERLAGAITGMVVDDSERKHAVGTGEPRGSL